MATTSPLSTPFQAIPLLATRISARFFSPSIFLGVSTTHCRPRRTGRGILDRTVSPSSPAVKETRIGGGGGGESQSQKQTRRRATSRDHDPFGNDHCNYLISFLSTVSRAVSSHNFPLDHVWLSGSTLKRCPRANVLQMVPVLHPHHSFISWLTQDGISG
jgi:hypothetical protein